MQLDRLDISVAHYRHLDAEHRTHIALLAILVLITISTHLTLLPHYPFERIHASSLGFELVNWITMIFLFWVVQCAHLPTSTYRLLSCGLMLWILGATADIMDELVAQPLWIAIYAEDLLRSSGILLSSIGVLSTLHHLFNVSNQLRQQALYDDLTRLPNRRYFQQKLQLEQQAPLALILLDLDHFKRINDNFGHDVGDRVLQQFGTLLQQHCPPSGLAARIGGEEFALLLPAASESELQPLADTLLATTRTIAPMPDQPLTVSLGMGMQQPGESTAALFKRVDLALYDAKEAGRNCCMWATGATHTG
ncbi:GGDEF domain-containing protein [Aeromonas jandaei]|uniref:GGDEF domain-containing protein n=1 Tax=Aeromonas jandaei TaxID=650 RepID=UPI000F53531D|nr:GGDEF domain-containing protein [Aeromonas jandaei]RQM70409.1 GGDEF domain-containing protein [Aeromonas jandaei]